MPRPASEVETARLEARVPVNVYEQMQRAAKLRGMTLTGYLIATAGEDARRTVEEADVLRLAAEDQVRFAKALTVGRIERLVPPVRFSDDRFKRWRGSQVVRPGSAKALSRVRFPPSSQQKLI